MGFDSDWMGYEWDVTSGAIKHGWLENGPFLAVIVLIKPPFIVDFPASHVWLPEGKCMENHGNILNVWETHRKLYENMVWWGFPYLWF